MLKPKDKQIICTWCGHKKSIKKDLEKAYQQGKADDESNQIVDDLIKLGYPHNFQHERSDIVDYMYAVTAIIKKAYKIKEQKNE